MGLKGRVMLAFGIMFAAAGIGTAVIAGIDAPEWADQVLTGAVSIPLGLYLGYEILRERGHLPSQQR